LCLLPSGIPANAGADQGSGRETAASPRQTGNRGRVGRRGWWRSDGEVWPTPIRAVETRCSPIRQRCWCLLVWRQTRSGRCPHAPVSLGPSGLVAGGDRDASSWTKPIVGRGAVPLRPVVAERPARFGRSESEEHSSVRCAVCAQTAASAKAAVWRVFGRTSWPQFARCDFAPAPS
jgi:hypothetical protein